MAIECFASTETLKRHCRVFSWEARIYSREPHVCG
jgi:hypothetical protein